MVESDGQNIFITVTHGKSLSQQCTSLESTSGSCCDRPSGYSMIRPMMITCPCNVDPLFYPTFGNIKTGVHRDTYYTV